MMVGLTNGLVVSMGLKMKAWSIIMIFMYLKEGTALNKDQCPMTSDIRNALEVKLSNEAEILQPQDASIEIIIDRNSLFNVNGGDCQEPTEVTIDIVTNTFNHEQDLLKDNVVQLMHTDLCATFTIELKFTYVNDTSASGIFSYGPILHELNIKLVSNSKIKPKLTEAISFKFKKQSVEVQWRNLCGRSMAIFQGNQLVKTLDTINPKRGSEIIGLEAEPCKIIPKKHFSARTFLALEQSNIADYYEEAFSAEAYEVPLRDSDFGHAWLNPPRVGFRSYHPKSECLQNTQVLFAVMKHGETVFSTDLHRSINYEEILLDTLNRCEVYAMFVNLTVSYKTRNEIVAMLGELIAPITDKKLERLQIFVDNVGEIKIPHSTCNFETKVKFKRMDTGMEFVLDAKKNKPLKIGDIKKIVACTEYKISLVLPESGLETSQAWNSTVHLVVPQLKISSNSGGDGAEFELLGYSNCDVLAFLVLCRHIGTNMILHGRHTSCAGKCILKMKETYNYQCKTRVELKDGSKSLWGEWQYVNPIREDSSLVAAGFALLLVLLLLTGIWCLMCKRRKPQMKSIQKEEKDEQSNVPPPSTLVSDDDDSFEEEYVTLAKIEKRTYKDAEGLVVGHFAVTNK